VFVLLFLGNRRGRDSMVVAFITIPTLYTISAHRHLRYDFETRSWPDVFDTTLCDTVCQ